MLDFKYLTIDELERLIVNLKNDLERCKTSTMDLNSSSEWKTKFINDTDEMLRAAETEILERTLLQSGNEGGAQD